MGTWGIGNLENDGTQDLITDESDKLFAKVIELLKNPLSAEYDEYDHDVLFYTIEKIVALADHALINSAPPVEEIEPLFSPFIDRWAKYHKSAGHDLPIERKAVIEQSFVELLLVAKSAEEGSFSHRVNLIMDKMNSIENS